MPPPFRRHRSAGRLAPVHPNLVRGPFLRDLAALQNANLGRAYACRVLFGAENGQQIADVTLRLTGEGPAPREVTRRLTLPPADPAQVADSLAEDGPWAPPVSWYPLGIDPLPTEPLQIYTDLLDEIGDKAAALHEMYPGTRLTLDEVALTGPTQATIRVSSDTDGTTYRFVTDVTDPAPLIGIDCSMAEWVGAHRDARPSPGQDAVLVEW